MRKLVHNISPSVRLSVYVIFSRVLRDSTPRFVGPSVRPSLFTFFLRSLVSLLLPKWSNDLKYGPCPTARDLGSRVSGLVSSPAVFCSRPFSYMADVVQMVRCKGWKSLKQRNRGLLLYIIKNLLNAPFRNDNWARMLKKKKRIKIKNLGESQMDSSGNAQYMRSLLPPGFYTKPTSRSRNPTIRTTVEILSSNSAYKRYPLNFRPTFTA